LRAARQNGALLFVALALCACPRPLASDATEPAPAAAAPPHAPERDAHKEARARARLLLRSAQQSLQAGRIADAARDATRAAELDPQLRAVHRVLASVAKKQGDGDLACTHMRAYVDAAPTPAAARERLLAGACGDAGAPNVAP
jgi:Tfp pilus assembly protein PilF